MVYWVRPRNNLFFRAQETHKVYLNIEGIQINYRPVDELNYADAEELTFLALKLCSYAQLLLDIQIAQAW
jgi:hypothetical protein